MDKRDLTVIENKNKTDENPIPKEVSRQTNPITKNFLEFHNEKLDKFGVIDLFKK